MTHYDDTSAIITRFKTLFTAAYPSIPVDYQNFEFYPPLTTWVRITVKNNASNLSSVGKFSSRNLGITYIDIFDEKNEGLSKTIEIHDYLNSIFRNLRIGNLLFGNSWFVQIDDDHYLAHSFRVSYHSDN